MPDHTPPSRNDPLFGLEFGFSLTLEKICPYTPFTLLVNGQMESREWS